MKLLGNLPDLYKVIQCEYIMESLFDDLKAMTFEERDKFRHLLKNRRRDLINRTIRVHIELEMEYPTKIVIIQAIRDTKTTFDLPMGIEMKDAHLAHIEILGDPDEES